MLPLEQVDSFRRQYDNTGVFVTAYRYNTPNQDDASLYGDFYLDFDINGLNEECFELIREDAIYAMAMFQAVFCIDESQFRVYFSGQKGVHVIVPAVTLGIRPDPNLNEIFKQLALDCRLFSKHKTVDLSIYDRRRLFRLPNSIHNESGLYKVPLTAQEVRELSFTEIKEMAKEPREITFARPRYSAKAYRMYQQAVEKWRKTEHKFTGNGERTISFTPPCIKHIEASSVAIGNRNNTATVLASHYQQRGYEAEEAYELLSEWNSQNCSPPLSNNELQTILDSVYKKGYRYGCSTLRILSQCDSSCRFAKERGRTNGTRRSVTRAIS